MFDAKLRLLIDPALNMAARILAKVGISANSLTLLGGLIGIACGVAIASQQYGFALALIGVNRLLDGLDGPIARLTKSTEFGGYLDSLSDYVFYLAVPIGFGIADPQNLLPALILIAAFTLTAVSFLAFAAIAARQDKNQVENQSAHGEKAFIYSTGLMEGAETIGFFVAMCLLPHCFSMLAYTFANLCLLTVLQRLAAAWRQFN